MPRSLSARLAAWLMLLLVGAAFFGLTQKLPRQSVGYPLQKDRLEMHFQRLASSTPAHLTRWLDSLGLDFQDTLYQQVQQEEKQGYLSLEASHQVWLRMPGQDSSRTLLVVAPLRQPLPASEALQAAAMLEAVSVLAGSSEYRPPVDVVFFWGNKPELAVDQGLDLTHQLSMPGRGTRGKPVLLSKSVLPHGMAVADAVLATGLPLRKSWLLALEGDLAQGTAMDVPENVSLPLLEAQTQTLLDVVLNFREQAKASEDAVAGYFVVPLIGQVAYTHLEARIVFLTLAGVWVCLLLLGLWRGAISLGSYLWSVCVIPVLIGTAATGTFLLWQMTLAWHPAFVWWGESLRGIPMQSVFLLSLTLLMLGGFWLMYGFFAGFLRAIDLGAAALTWAILGCGLVVFGVPFGSALPAAMDLSGFALFDTAALHFWLIPMFWGLLSWVYVLLRGRQTSDYNPADTLILTLFFLPAGWYLGELWLPLATIEGLLFADKTLLWCSALGLWLALFLPQWRVLAGGLRWTMPLLVLVTGLGLLLYGHIGSAFSKHHKRPNSAFFAINLSSDQAFWGSTDPSTDTYTRQFFGNAPDISPMPDIFPWANQRFLTARDSMRYLPAPQIDLLTDTLGQTDSLRYLTLRYTPSQRQPDELRLYIRGGQRLNFGAAALQTDSLYVRYRPADTLLWQVIALPQDTVHLTALEIKSGLEEVWNYTRMPRRLHTMPRPGILGDAVLVRKDFILAPKPPRR